MFRPWPVSRTFLMALLIAWPASLLAADKPVGVFRNGSDQTIRLGVAEVGEKSAKLIKDLKAGEAVSYHLNVGSTWVVYDASNRPLLTHKVTSAPQQEIVYPVPSAAPPSAAKRPASAPSRKGSSGPAPDAVVSRPAPEREKPVNLEKACFDAVQGKVAWNRAGASTWEAANVTKLCAGTKDPSATIACFEKGIRDHGDWGTALGACQAGAASAATVAANPEEACFNAVQGNVAWDRAGSKTWNPGNVKSLCAGTNNPTSTIACFEGGIRDHGDWSKAIADCKGDGGGSTYAVPTPRSPTSPSTPAPTPSPATSPATTKAAFALSASTVSDYQRWLKADQPDTRFTNRARESAPPAPFTGLISMSQGYHVAKMDPTNPSDNGVSAPEAKIFDFDLDDHGWHPDDKNYALPLSLVSRRGKGTKGGSNTRISFTESQRLEFESQSVSVGVSAKGASAKAGFSKSTERTEMEKSGMTSIYEGRYGHWSTLLLDKRYVKLHPEFVKYVRGKGGNSMKSTADFRRFFDDFGTHHALRAMLGGKISVETMVSSKEMAQALTKTTKSNYSASIPIKAATVSAETSFENKKSESLKREDSTSTTKLVAVGGVIGANMDSWQLDSYDPSSMYPIKVMLEPIHELIRPQLFDSKDASDETAINALRKRMASEWSRYIAELEANNKPVEGMDPFAYRVTINYVKCTKQDDNEVVLGGNNEPDIYGTISVINATKAPLPGNVMLVTASTLPTELEGYEILGKAFDRAADNNYEVKKGTKLPVTPNTQTVLMPTAKPNSSGKLVGTLPPTHLSVVATLREFDHTGDGVLSAGVVHYEVPAQMPFKDRKPITPKPVTFGDPGSGEFEMSVTFTPVPITINNQAGPDLPKWGP